MGLQAQGSRLPRYTVSWPSTEPRVSVPLAAVPPPVMVGIMAGCALVVCALLGLLGWRRVKGQR